MRRIAIAGGVRCALAGAMAVALAGAMAVGLAGAMAVLAGCPAERTAAVPPSNRPVAEPATVTAADPLGWIAIVPPGVPWQDPPPPPGRTGWLPEVDGVMALVPAQGPLPPAGTRVRVLDVIHEPAEAIVGAVREIPYGCDGGTLEATVLEADARLAGDLAWVLPQAVPPAWRPRGRPIERGEATATRRTWRIDTLAFELERVDAAAARLRVHEGDRRIGEARFERAAMAGAERGPLALDERQVGMPEPEVAFALTDDGPWLVVMLVPGHEGVSLVTYLAGARLEKVDAMTAYLYQCAY